MSNRKSPRSDVRIREVAGWPHKVSNQVFVQWCLKFSSERLETNQWGSWGNSGYRIGDANGNHFAIEPTGPLAWKLSKMVGFEADEVKPLLMEAAEKTSKGDTGEDVAYQAELVSPTPPLDASFGLNLARMLGERVRIDGARRLSRYALLDFTEGEAETPTPLFPPDIRIKATIFVPGPAPGDLANQAAASTMEVVAAICAFALSRPVDTPPVIFPVDAKDMEEILARRDDVSILGLARDSISLDIIDALSTLGDRESVLRVRNALITIHHAQRQSNSDIATMLYVCAIEALITPGETRPWRKNRVVARFRDGLLSLCTHKIDEILNHPNVEMAFDHKKRGQIVRQRKELVERIYDLRSFPTHTGITPSGAYMAFAYNDFSMRAALLSDISRAAVLAYIQSPRSFLTGMPKIDPAVQVNE
ncbi:hypothetical protein [Actinomadura sp. BRA 177]|uniref:hypothetical protein n=1 Tax=Actinomadura sp. BRA 177 TaxID=2745202 RepID=UPI0015953A72|nr:hypothetical protein [Actinomadura sp. BRA 177]NVI92698.1 hypothetical protein [Actinomadura sp. BRA 177]